MSKLLVVVDMQNDFIDGPLGTKEAQAIVDPIYHFIAQFIKNKSYDEYGIPIDKIIFTKDTHYEDTIEKISYLDSQEGKNLPVPHCIYQSRGWYICDKLGDFAINHGYTILKETFGSTFLGEICTNKKFDEIHFVGVCTDICVISNALLVKAFDPEAKIIVHKDLCAGVTPESHEIALKAMQACQIEIV